MSAENTPGKRQTWINLLSLVAISILYALILEYFRSEEQVRHTMSNDGWGGAIASAFTAVILPGVLYLMLLIFWNIRVLWSLFRFKIRGLFLILNLLMIFLAWVLPLWLNSSVSNEERKSGRTKSISTNVKKIVFSDLSFSAKQLAAYILEDDSLYVVLRFEDSDKEMRSFKCFAIQEGSLAGIRPEHSENKLQKIRAKGIELKDSGFSIIDFRTVRWLTLDVKVEHSTQYLSDKDFLFVDSIGLDYEVMKGLYVSSRQSARKGRVLAAYSHKEKLAVLPLYHEGKPQLAYKRAQNPMVIREVSLDYSKLRLHLLNKESNHILTRDYLYIIQESRVHYCTLKGMYETRDRIALE